MERFGATGRVDMDNKQEDLRDFFFENILMMWYIAPVV